MFDWLFEGRLTVYLVLAGAAALLLLLYARDRRRKWLLGAGAFALLAGTYFLQDKLVETRREQVTRKVREMAQGVQHRDMERLFAHVSDEFRVETRLGPLSKKQLRAFAEEELQARPRGELKVWDFKFPDKDRKGEPIDPRGRRTRVVFLFKQTAHMPAAFVCDADFVRDADGQWRMSTFGIFEPVGEGRTPMDVTSLPR